MNPIEDFLEEAGIAKESFSFGRTFRGGAEMLGGGVARGLGATAAAATIGGVSLAASKVYDAMTKSRDFKRVLEYNPDIAEHHVRDPRMVNQFYSSLRHMNSDFAKDPTVAGTFMRQMIDSPLQAGGILSTQAVPARDKFKSPDAAEQGMMAAGKFFGAKPSVPNAELAEEFQRKQLRHNIKNKNWSGK